MKGNQIQNIYLQDSLDFSVYMLFSTQYMNIRRYRKHNVRINLLMASLNDGAHMKVQKKKNVPRSQNILYTHMCTAHTHIYIHTHTAAFT